MMDIEDNTAVPDYLQRLSLRDRGFIVVGAGLGIGRQTAHALAAAGAKVLCADRHEDRAEKLAAETGGIPWVGQVTSQADVERLLADAEKALGGIDGFVDVVAKAEWKSIADLDEPTWNSQFQVCLQHAYLLGRLAAPKMAARGGSMVFIASVSGIAGAQYHAAYGAAKAALMSWVRTLAVELGPQGIRANAVAPGTTLTPRVEAMVGDRQEQAGRVAPLGRLAKPEDVAAAALFLASPLAGYVSGQTLVVDGGVTAKFPYPMVDFE